MTKLGWDSRNYGAGVDRCAFYPKGAAGYAWSGVISVKESTPDVTQSLLYYDGVGSANQMALGSFSALLSAVTYPAEFQFYDGYLDNRSGQIRREFDFAYRVMMDNGHYAIHLVYNATATPSMRNHTSINSVIDMELLEWDLTTRPEVIPYARASSHFVIDTRFVNPGLISDLEAVLYGGPATVPIMPTVPNLLAIFEARAILKITNFGDGTWQAEGPDSVVRMIDSTTFEIDWPSVVYLTSDLYEVSSL